MQMNSDVRSLVPSNEQNSPNQTSANRTALKELNKDKSIIILPADMGRVTVLMNITEYRETMTAMVGDTNTYTKLGKDSTHKYKNKLINLVSM